jgi:hypothetical protein
MMRTTIKSENAKAALDYKAPEGDEANENASAPAAEEAPATEAGLETGLPIATLEKQVAVTNGETSIDLGFLLVNPAIVSGDDKDNVRITEDGSRVEFVTPPQARADNNGDNVYEFTIFDGLEQFDIAVTVLDIDLV